MPGATHSSKNIDVHIVDYTLHIHKKISSSSSPRLRSTVGHRSPTRCSCRSTPNTAHTRCNSGRSRCRHIPWPLLPALPPLSRRPMCVCVCVGELVPSVHTVYYTLHIHKKISSSSNSSPHLSSSISHRSPTLCICYLFHSRARWTARMGSLLTTVGEEEEE